MAEKKLSVNLPIVRNPYLNLETNNQFYKSSDPNKFTKLRRELKSKS